VLILSSHANDSRHIPNEMERAVSRGIAIITIRVEDVMPSQSLADVLGTIHWLDAMTPPAREASAGVERQ
jgi:hypothetical protein